MNARSAKLALVVLLASISAQADDRPKERPDLPGPAQRPYFQNYKDIALAGCIAEAYKTSPDAVRDAQASAGGIFEWSNYDVENSTGKVPDLIRRTLAQTYGSFQGPAVRLDLMKCFDMYYGKELDDLARRYVTRPDRTYAEDYPEDP